MGRRKRRKKNFVRPLYVDGTKVVIDFGIHEGKDLESIPCEYLHWLVNDSGWFRNAKPRLYELVCGYLSDPPVARELAARLRA